MHVEELKSNCGSAIVKLSYTEISKLDNALLECTDNSDTIRDLKRQFGVLHVLTKEGALELLRTTYDIKIDEKQRIESRDGENQR